MKWQYSLLNAIIIASLVSACGSSDSDSSSGGSPGLENKTYSKCMQSQNSNGIVIGGVWLAIDAYDEITKGNETDAPAYSSLISTGVTNTYHNKATILSADMEATLKKDDSKIYAALAAKDENKGKDSNEIGLLIEEALGKCYVPYCETGSTVVEEEQKYGAGDALTFKYISCKKNDPSSGKNTFGNGEFGGATFE